MKIKGLSPDMPSVTNAAGGKQSDTPYRLDLIPPLAILRESEVLSVGAKKYGEWNWKNIPIQDHLNHILQHVYAYLAGDKSDDHLANIVCRAHFALELQEEARTDDPRQTLTASEYEMTKPSEILERLYSLAERNGVCIDCFISLREVNGYYGAGTGNGQRFRCEDCHKRREAFEELDEASKAIKTLATRSNHSRFNHGAIVLKGGAIQSMGYNFNDTHAEVHALKKLWPSKRAGTTVFNLRFAVNSISNSRPCDSCMDYMVQNSVKNIWFFENGELVKERL